MKKNIWKDSKVSGWGTIENFFECVEFQNQGAAHVHTCLWTTATIEYLNKSMVIFLYLIQNMNQNCIEKL